MTDAENPEEIRANEPAGLAGHRSLFGAVWDDFESSASDQARGVTQPPVQKPYPGGSELIDLPDVADIADVGTAPIRDVIARRRSRRSFTDAPLSVEELAFLLWATQGVAEVRESAGGMRTLRTVPSGGARHPFETYLAVNRVAGLDAGLYRYLPLDHKLLLIERGDMAARTREACAGQRFAGNAAVVFIWTAIPYRTAWRYSICTPKLIGLDAGHLCQNLYLAAESIDCGTCAIGAYHQSEMDALVGVDGEDEFVVYCAPVGRIET